MSPVEEFKRNLEYFYNGARCYFALRQISDGEDCDYLSLWEDGGHFDGIQIFNKYRHPVMPKQDGEVDEDIELDGRDFWWRQFAKAAEEREAYERFLEEHKDELYKYILDPIDDFYALRGQLVEMRPDFHMQLKVDPKTDKVVFAADVHSIFDIAWYTLVRYMVDVQLTDEGTLEKQYPDGKVCVCKSCGKAFVRTADQNRRQYCGESDCECKRTRERAQRKRNKDKIAEQQQLTKEKKGTDSCHSIGNNNKKYSLPCYRRWL